jgi:hypothetical protein
MRVQFLTVYCLLCLLCGAAVAQDLPVLKPGDISGTTIVSTDYYSGPALYGYIDGGAELYLEYGFKKLGRQEVRSAKETIVVEIYQMAGANEAYGIFSVQRFKCVPVDSLFPYTCLSKYQLQAVVGNCYLSIVNESGTRDAQQKSVEIFRVIRAKAEPQHVNFPELLRKPELAAYKSGIIVACGRLGVQNGFSEWDSLFQTIPRFTLTLLPIEMGSERLSIAHLRFSTDRDSKEFCRLAGFDDTPTGTVRTQERAGIVRIVRRLSNEEIYFGEATVTFPRREEYFALMLK